MPHCIIQPWQRNLSKTASGKTGVVHVSQSLTSQIRGRSGGVTETSITAPVGLSILHEESVHKPRWPR